MTITDILIIGIIVVSLAMFFFWIKGWIKSRIAKRKLERMKRRYEDLMKEREDK